MGKDTGTAHGCVLKTARIRDALKVTPVTCPPKPGSAL